MSIRSTRPRAPRGFTLLEVMVASALLLFGIAAVVAGLSHATKTGKHQRYVTQGIHVAESVLENLLLANAGHPDLESGAHGPRWFNEVGEQLGAANGSTFEANWTVVLNEPIPDMKRLTVTVTWLEDNVERRLSLTTDRP